MGPHALVIMWCLAQIYCDVADIFEEFLKQFCVIIGGEEYKFSKTKLVLAGFFVVVNISGHT
jgi:hypothetical protein